MKNKEKGIDSRTKWSYSIGATGRDMAYALVSMYLILYVQYTMHLTTAQFAVITGAMVVCMVWDAVNDLLMGMIIENAKFKMGKFKPWIITGAVLNAIIIICMFTIRPQGWAFVAFFSVSYLLWGMTYTMNDIAYWGMLPSLSSDPKVRDMLVTLMSIFICIGQFSVAGVVPTIIAGNAVTAYRVVALVVALCFVAFQTLTTLGVKERPRVDNAEKLTLKGMFNIFKRNDQLVVIGVSSLLFNIGNGLLIMFGVNFFNFEFGYAEAGDLVFLFTVMYGLGTLFSQASYAFLSSKFSRMKLLKVTITCLILGYLALLGFGYVLPRSVVLLNVIGFVIFFFQGLYNLVVIVMINNTIEYDEYKYNERHDSIISAVRSFSTKLASGINQGMSTLILIVSGIYALTSNISLLETKAGMGEITSEEVLELADTYIFSATNTQTFVLRLGMVIVPIVTLLAAFILIKKKYKIDEAEYKRLVDEIEARKKSLRP